MRGESVQALRGNGVMVRRLKIGDKTVQIPIVQGGMGVGISRSSLAGAVAKEGGVGIISTAQIGYDEEGFEKEQHTCNLKAIRKHIARAKELAQGNGLIGVNVMVALKHYREHVREAAQAGADVIVCGAGLPLDLPELVGRNSEQTGQKPPYIAPIVSSKRAAELILRRWDTRYHTTADFLVVEGPEAGGHLGYTNEQLADIDGIGFDEIVRAVIACKRPYEEKYGHPVPVVAGGGIFDASGAAHVFELGADAVQVASRFVATKECDADAAYKQAYVEARSEDIVIVKSPVGMPGRALNNSFIKRVSERKEPIRKCYQCLEKCNPAEVPYCITKALTDAVKGDIENGLVFCGANVDKIKEITTVHTLMKELCPNVVSK